jgi:hypothetical protein
MKHVCTISYIITAQNLVKDVPEPVLMQRVWVVDHIPMAIVLDARGAIIMSTAEQGNTPTAGTGNDKYKFW